MKGVKQTGRDTCYFCDSEGPIETHHLVPRRYEGSDNDENLVDLCPSCHERLERLYDDDVLQKIVRGAEKARGDRSSTLATDQQLALFEMFNGYSWVGEGPVSEDGHPSTEHFVSVLNEIGIGENAATEVLETARRETLAVPFEKNGHTFWRRRPDSPRHDAENLPGVLKTFCFICENETIEVNGHCAKCGSEIDDSTKTAAELLNDNKG